MGAVLLVATDEVINQWKDQIRSDQFSLVLCV